jgi:protocatechuate 3,4-dioxygenase beta subunit
MAYCEVEAMDSVLSRREMLALLGMSSAALLDAHAVEAAMAASAESVPTCVVRPAQTEGPYFVDERLNRSDIRTDPASGTARPGAALEVLFRVGRMSRNACAPLVGATVDVWHCDALGAYSDVRDPGGSTEGQKFLRGYQVTDVAGSAVFTTIYPGWYPGRAVHIHFKIRTAPGTSPVYEFTSQIYFDDAITDRVHALPPYALHGSRRLRNERDGLFGSSGRQLTVAPAEKSRGYAVAFDVGLQIA